MEFDDDEYNENRIMPPPKSFNRMDEDWDTENDGQFAMGFEDDMEDEDLENMDNIEDMELLAAIFFFHLQVWWVVKQPGLGRLTVFGPLKWTVKSR